MCCNSVREVDFALLAFTYSGACVILEDFQLGSAGEGWGDQEVAGEEHCEGDYQPFQADEDYGVDLESIAIAHFGQIFCGLHFGELINDLARRF